ncbi:hypothetical protein DTW89_02385 [Acidovorax sp. BoFeN1]|uniref:carboxylesterase family protein n=1 Tax=Acidovorax sp. BoFeN1 TaxID=1231053 RepID=UPI000E095182|nr:carboxylesterase family protein [Acidovorax sp. BoFeN1]RDD95193.1 hypothetical protein DTW89_02385 [Acidovorax sp. BoFeN1]
MAVTIRSGALRGRFVAEGAVNAFKGMIVAAPRVGELRWKAPQPSRSWSGVRGPFEPGSQCPQSGRLASAIEDCLYLNAWAPHTKPSLTASRSKRSARNSTGSDRGPASHGPRASTYSEETT